jgi:hypothetical protein
VDFINLACVCHFSRRMSSYVVVQLTTSSDVGKGTQEHKCSWHAIRGIPKRWLVESLGHTFWPLSPLQKGEMLKLLVPNSISSCNNMRDHSSLEESPWESNSLSASQEITHLYVTRRFIAVSQDLSVVTSAQHAFWYCFFSIHFNNIFTFVSKFLSFSLASQVFRLKCCMDILSFPLYCSPPYLIIFDIVTI